jgi:atypical dual specificity phosphatase
MGLVNFRVVVEGKLAGMGFPDREAIDELKKMGYRGLITLTDRPLDYEEIKNFEYLHIPLSEFKAPYLDQLADAVNFIESVDGPVAVHCQLGRSKTGCILGAYMIYKFKLPAHEVAKKLKNIFDGYIELSEQVEALKEFERFLKTKAFYEEECTGRIKIELDSKVVEKYVRKLKVYFYEDSTEIIVKTNDGEILVKFEGEAGKKILRSICYS